MRLVDRFKQIVAALRKEEIRFAVAGGLAASVYRAEERTTKDIDLAIMGSADAKETATKILEGLGLRASLVRKADLEGGPMFAIKRKNTPPYLVVGRDPDDPRSPGVDLILPDMPWAKDALARAEHHLVDFGFGPLPCLTVEDVLLSKFYSSGNNSQRFKDLDDLKSIFEGKHDLDLVYLHSQMMKLGLTLPKELVKKAPALLRKASKAVRQHNRRR